VLFRTATNGTIELGTSRTVISFEVDHFEETSGEGWSVLLTGQVDDIAENDPIAVKAPLPWAGGDRPVLLRLRPTQCSGRRIVAR
jgi:hypothetical protein